MRECLIANCGWTYFPRIGRFSLRGGCVRLLADHGSVLTIQFYPSLAHAAHVLRSGDRLQVLRVATGTVEAEMIDFQPLRDGADECLVRDSMS